MISARPAPDFHTEINYRVRDTFVSQASVCFLRELSALQPARLTPPRKPEVGAPPVAAGAALLELVFVAAVEVALVVTDAALVVLAVALEVVVTLFEVLEDPKLAPGRHWL